MPPLSRYALRVRRETDNDCSSYCSVFHVSLVLVLSRWHLRSGSSGQAAPAIGTRWTSSTPCPEHDNTFLQPLAWAAAPAQSEQQAHE